MFFNNYKAWDIDSEDFSQKKTKKEKIEFLLNFAILAPSSHNTQPWLFRVNENSIKVFINKDRHLEYSDSSKRLLYIAIGCAIQNIKIAAEHYGFQYNIKYEKNPNTKIATIILDSYNNNNNSCDEDIFNSIKKRVSNRSGYTKKEVTNSTLDKLKKLNTWQNIDLKLLNNSKDKEGLAKIMGRGMKEKMSETKFRRELAGWLRNNITWKKDGMPGFGHEMSFFLSFLAPWILRFINVSEVEQKRAEKKVENFPEIGIISSKLDNELSWIETGELLQNILLYLHSKKMAASIMVALIESQEARKELSNFLNTNNLFTEYKFPQIFFGFGFPKKLPNHSPRLNPKNVIKN